MKQSTGTILYATLIVFVAMIPAILLVMEVIK